MAIQYPDTLLIGNIHWIVDTNYILQTSPKTVLLDGQLLDFQVNHICSHLHIPINNVFGTPIPRSFLLKEISNKIKSSHFNPSPECVHCVQYGLLCHTKDNNIYTFRNIGGKPLLEFKLNTNQTEMESIGNFIPYELNNQANNEVVPFTLESRLQPVTDVDVLHGGNGNLRKTAKKHHHTSKRRISDMYRKNSTDTIDLFGKLDDDHHIHPGMLNTPLMFIIYHIPLTNTPKTGYGNEFNNIMGYYQHRLLTLKKNAKINKFERYYHKYNKSIFNNVTTPIDILSIIFTLLKTHMKIIYNPTIDQMNKLKPLGIFLKHTYPSIKYTLMMQITDIGWVHYDGNYNTHIQNDYFVELGNYDEMMSYNNRMCSKYMFAIVYE